MNQERKRYLFEDMDSHNYQVWQVPISTGGNQRPKKNQCVSLSAKARKDHYPTAGGQAGVRSSSDLLFYSELQLIEWGPHRIGRKIRFTQSRPEDIERSWWHVGNILNLKRQTFLIHGQGSWGSIPGNNPSPEVMTKMPSVTLPLMSVVIRYYRLLFIKVWPKG